MPALPSVSVMQRAYRRSDTSYDGLFYLGVRTTGVFCRPSCGARKPLPRNVEYFATPAEALFAGYRPCKRCKPLTAIGTPPVWVEPLLREIERNPSGRFADAEIRSRGIEPTRLRRFFKRSYGMTFQAYCRARRMGKALEQIRRGADLDDVTLGFGYGSHSGFREAFGRTFGTTPGRAHRTEAIKLAWIESPLGPLLAGATQSSLVLLEFTDRRMLETQFRSLRRHFACPIVPGDNGVLAQVQRQLAEYFAGTRKTFSVPLSAPGSQFQQRVWKELQTIPCGTTISYEELACRVGVPHGQRAVGTTNGLNRISILIPCHRVVNKNGNLGGYGGGLWRKKALLELERGERRYETADDRRQAK